MKKKILILMAGLALLAFACNNSNEDPAQEDTSCKAPTADGSIHEFSGNCRVSADEEHIRLEGVTVTGTQKITLWVKASDATGTKGIKIEIDNTNVVYTNLDNNPGSNTFTDAHGGLSNSTLCFDTHFEESPVHVLGWKGTDCDTGAEANALFNSEADTLNTGDEVDSANKFLYKIENATVSTIKTKAPILVEP